MTMHFTGLAAALALIGAAAADVAPEPPADPIPEACKPLIGVWQRTEPEKSRFASTWSFLIVDSRRATTIAYVDEGEGVNIETQTASHILTCTPGEGGVMKVAFIEASHDAINWSMDIVLGEGSFTTTQMTIYDSPGAPDPDWKPTPYTVTYKKIAH